MTKKKEPAFLVCPRWNELAANAQVSAGSVVSGSAHRSTKIMLAIKGGQPVARSTLRKALLAIRQASGVVFDVHAYIVDQRTKSR